MGNSQAHGGTRAELKLIVMPGLVPGIHAFSPYWHSKTWMAGTSPAMTAFGCGLS
jgi:hypothetical protein